MDLGEFFKKHVEDNLLGDLDVMTKKSQENSGNGKGGLCYPIIISILSGIELLGWISYGKHGKFDGRKGSKYFRHYWDNFLVPVNSRYAGLSGLIRSSARNGIAHTYTTTSVYVDSKNECKNECIKISLDKRQLYIDCLTLYVDFKQSYENYKDKIIGKTKAQTKDKDQAQKNLNSFIEENSRKVDDKYQQLIDAHNLECIVKGDVINTNAVQDGATGPLSPKTS